MLAFDDRDYVVSNLVLLGRATTIQGEGTCGLLDMGCLGLPELRQIGVHNQSLGDQSRETLVSSQDGWATASGFSKTSTA